LQPGARRFPPPTEEDRHGHEEHPHSPGRTGPAVLNGAGLLAGGASGVGLAAHGSAGGGAGSDYTGPDARAVTAVPANGGRDGVANITWF
jgi:hypothetical protein